MFKWAPKIDRWIPESVNINNTTSQPASYEFAPKITDIQTGKEEMEEQKYNITGHGKLTLKQIKEKIIQILEGMLEDAKSDELSQIERLHHGVCTSPELNNFVKQYSEHIKEKHIKNKVD